MRLTELGQHLVIEVLEIPPGDLFVRLLARLLVVLNIALVMVLLLLFGKIPGSVVALSLLHSPVLFILFIVVDVWIDGSTSRNLHLRRNLNDLEIF